MANDNQSMNSNQQDHDLLIKIDTKVEILGNEMRSLRDDTKDRIKDVENNKLSIQEFKQFLIEKTKDDLRFDTELVNLQKKDDALAQKLETHTKYIYMAIGGLAVLQVVLSFIK